MDILIIKLILFVSLGFFLLQKSKQYFFALFLQSVLILITSIWAIKAFICGNGLITIPLIFVSGKQIFLTIDKLSAFFILVINFTMLTGMIYASGYLKPYFSKKNKFELALHYFNFIWMHLSMLLVCMFRDAFAFLIVWELLSISSFFLVIFESEKEGTIKTGLNYLLQMHIGFIFILSGFLIAYQQTGSELSFDSLLLYFSNHQPFIIFLLFFIGFGIKAGFMPLHTWLPHAHPAAPSHVSGVMSGVMIKMGIYGILRVLTYIHTDLFYIGLFILAISLVSGILGVTMAIVQHDFKKLLAYHSIENIGIIGIGIGLGVIGIASNMPVLAVLGFAGGILHILNHSLFKSLLFFASGSVYNKTHTRVIEDLGGLIKKMPKTAFLFLLGALAICGLPPFNGFISEFLIYSGMFKSLHAGSLHITLIVMGSIIGLVLIGGLAIFCFTKVFSIIFLGIPRSNKTESATEVGNSMLIPEILISIVILFIGLCPVAIIKLINGVAGIYVKDISYLQPTLSTLYDFSIFSLVFILILGILWLIRNYFQKKSIISYGPTWGCGYKLSNPEVHQYTATSYADNLGELSKPVTRISKHFNEFKEEEIFPGKRKFEAHSVDIFEKKLINRPSKFILACMKKSAVFQTGNLQHYLLYALVFILLIFLLTTFHFI